MTSVPQPKEPQRPPVRVRAGGWVAQCPRCESRDFLPAATPELLACASCGAESRRAELLQQIASQARLAAELLAERAQRLSSLAN